MFLFSSYSTLYFYVSHQKSVLSQKQIQRTIESKNKASYFEWTVLQSPKWSVVIFLWNTFLNKWSKFQGMLFNKENTLKKSFSITSFIFIYLMIWAINQMNSICRQHEGFFDIIFIQIVKCNKHYKLVSETDRKIKYNYLQQNYITLLKNDSRFYVMTNSSYR